MVPALQEGQKGENGRERHAAGGNRFFFVLFSSCSSLVSRRWNTCMCVAFYFLFFLFFFFFFLTFVFLHRMYCLLLILCSLYARYAACHVQLAFFRFKPLFLCVFPSSGVIGVVSSALKVIATTILLLSLLGSLDHFSFFCFIACMRGLVRLFFLADLTGG